MKLALVVLLITIFGSVVFGKQTRHSSKQARHSRKRIHHAHRHASRKPIVTANLPVQRFSDTRRLALLQYFQACHCPAARWVDTFIEEADRQGVDWRLVPSISMVESTGGKHYKNRNILGWRSAAARFHSEEAGIQYVTSRFGKSPLYKGKSLLQMLKTYNSARHSYATLVTGVIKRLTAIEDGLKIQQASIASDQQLAFQPVLMRVATAPVFLH